MIFTTTEEIITKQVLNETTGEVESQDFKQLKKHKKIRGGFRMVYLLYDEAVHKVISSKKDFEIITGIREMFTHKKTEVELSPTDLAKRYNVSRRKVSELLKKLKEVKMLTLVYSTSYRFNPFMYVPYRANGEELQNEWNQLTTKDR